MYFQTSNNVEGLVTRRVTNAMIVSGDHAIINASAGQYTTIRTNMSLQHIIYMTDQTGIFKFYIPKPGTELIGV